MSINTKLSNLYDFILSGGLYGGSETYRNMPLPELQKIIRMIGGLNLATFTAASGLIGARSLGLINPSSRLARYSFAVVTTYLGLVTIHNYSMRSFLNAVVRQRESNVSTPPWIIPLNTPVGPPPLPAAFYEDS